MYKRFITLCAALLLATSAWSQTTLIDRPVLTDYDLDTPTEAADADQVVVSVNLTNAALAIAAQPDTPRNLVVLVTDTTDSINAGSIVIVGTDVNGAALTWTIDVSGHAGGAVTYTGTQIFKTVTSVTPTTVGVLGGAGDELIQVGTGSVVAYIYCSLTETRAGPYNIETSGSSATITGVGTAAAFADAPLGSVLYVTGFTPRVITTYTTSASVAVDTAINLDRDYGYGFRYRRLNCGYADTDGWILTAQAQDSTTLAIAAIAGSATGGIDYTLEGKYQDIPVLLASGNFSAVRTLGVPAATWGDTFGLSDKAAYYRVGLKFGTNDDTSDTVPEKIRVTIETNTDR